MTHDSGDSSVLEDAAARPVGARGCCVIVILLIYPHKNTKLFLHPPLDLRQEFRLSNQLWSFTNRYPHDELEVAVSMIHTVDAADEEALCKFGRFLESFQKEDGEVPFVDCQKLWRVARLLGIGGGELRERGERDGIAGYITAGRSPRLDSMKTDQQRVGLVNPSSWIQDGGSIAELIDEDMGVRLSTYGGLELVSAPQPVPTRETLQREFADPDVFFRFFDPIYGKRVSPQACILLVNNGEAPRLCRYRSSDYTKPVDVESNAPIAAGTLRSSADADMVDVNLNYKGNTLEASLHDRMLAKTNKTSKDLSILFKPLRSGPAQQLAAILWAWYKYEWVCSSPFLALARELRSASSCESMLQLLLAVVDADPKVSDTERSRSSDGMMEMQSEDHEDIFESHPTSGGGASSSAAVAPAGVGAAASSSAAGVPARGGAAASSAASALPAISSSVAKPASSRGRQKVLILPELVQRGFGRKGVVASGEQIRLQHQRRFEFRMKEVLAGYAIFQKGRDKRRRIPREQGSSTWLETEGTPRAAPSEAVGGPAERPRRRALSVPTARSIERRNEDVSIRPDVLPSATYLEDKNEVYDAPATMDFPKVAEMVRAMAAEKEQEAADFPKAAEKKLNEYLIAERKKRMEHDKKKQTERKKQVETERKKQESLQHDKKFWCECRIETLARVAGVADADPSGPGAHLLRSGSYINFAVPQIFREREGLVVRQQRPGKGGRGNVTVGGVLIIEDWLQKVRRTAKHFWFVAELVAVLRGGAPRRSRGASGGHVLRETCPPPDCRGRFGETPAPAVRGKPPVDDRAASARSWRPIVRAVSGAHVRDCAFRGRPGERK